MHRRATVTQEYWPYREPFAISRGVVTGSDVVVVTITDGDAIGRGEACPIARYRETPDSVQAQIQQHVGALEAGLERAELQALMGPGAARNAVDCALWDLEAKLTGWRAPRLAGMAALQGYIQTSQTIGLDTPQKMAARARAAWSPLATAAAAS